MTIGTLGMRVMYVSCVSHRMVCTKFVMRKSHRMRYGSVVEDGG